MAPLSAQATMIIAALGDQPQVATFALDGLLERGIGNTAVLLRYLSPPHQRISKDSLIPGAATTVMIGLRWSLDGGGMWLGELWGNGR